MLNLFSAFILMSTTSAFAAVATKYEVVPEIEASRIRVLASTNGMTKGGRPSFEIAKEFGSANDYFADVSGMKVIEPRNAKFLPIAGIPNRWQLDRALPSETLRFEYSIKVHQELPNQKVRFKPSLNSTSYYSSGFPLFVYPLVEDAQGKAGIDNQTFQVQFRVPKGWNSFASLQKTGKTWTARRLDELLYSTVALGDYRVTEFQLPNGTPLSVALNGSWKFPDIDFKASVFRIISSQIELLKTWDFPVYSIVLSQAGEKGASGSGLVNAFEMFGHKDVSLSDLQYVISHENFHYWNGHRIRYEGPENRWFSEGFTEYYSFLTLSRMKLWSLEDTLENFSKTIDEYETNPISAEMTFKDVAPYFWDYLYEYGRLSYTKGLTIALALDVRLRAASGNQLSLDGFMRFLDRKYYESGLEVNDDKLKQELVLYSQQDWDDFFQQYVSEKETIPVDGLVKAAGLRMITYACERTDLGLRLVPYICKSGKACGYRIREIDPCGPAFAQGLRIDQIVSEWSPSMFQNAQVGQVIELKTRNADGTSTTYKYSATKKTGSCSRIEFVKNASSKSAEIRSSLFGY